MQRPATFALLARVLGFLAFVLLATAPGTAAAYKPPPPEGAVTDLSGRLSADDDRAIEEHIAAYRARTSNELAVLMVATLGGETVDDVAYGTFNAWGVGKKGADNGVLLVIAPNERKMRIETGKGVGDRLTDLESSHILRDRVGPLLAKERFRDAILAGLTGIENALDGFGAPPPVPALAPAAGAQPRSVVTFILPLLVLGFCGVVVCFFIVLIWRAIRGRSSGRVSARDPGSSWDSGAPYSSGSSGSSFGGGGGSDYSGGGGGSDFGGGGGGSDFGGGSSGGGGSSDSY